MRAGAVVSEAGRNLASGTSRALLLALVLAAVLGGLAAADVRAVVDVLRGAHDFRAAGASVQVLDAPGGVDGARCQALAQVEGVTAAGALRSGDPVRALALPSLELTTWEATPGLLDVLTAPEPADRRPGLWLATDVADTLAAAPGRPLATAAGDATVAGVYPFPDDGRDRALAYAVLAPVPATGTFDACWAEIWPPVPATTALLRTALEPTAATSDVPVTLGQLNPRLGTTYDGARLLAERPTRPVPVAAVVVGLALGLAAVRARRLELAAALHARVPRPALTTQVLLETLTWVAAGTVVVAPVLGWLAGWGNPDPAAATWTIGLRTVLAGGAATLLGATLGIAATREKHLFRYFKDR